MPKLIKTIFGGHARQRILPNIWDIYLAMPAVLRSRMVKFRHTKIWRAIPERCGVVLVHIPKTGGTTLATLLYGDTINHYPVWVWVLANERRSEESVFIVVLREPLERIVSAIMHCLRGERASLADLSIGRWLRKHHDTIDEMVVTVLGHIETGSKLSHYYLFRPYGFWLNGNPRRLRRFRLNARVRSASPSGLWLNAGTVVAKSGLLSAKTEELARRCLSADYLEYQDARNESVDDVCEVLKFLNMEAR